MPRTAAPRFVKPREACAFEFDGEDIVLSPNEVLDADHPLVRARPNLFMAIEVTRHRPMVQQATAAPGEVRGG